MLPFHHLLRPAIFNGIYDIFEPEKGSFSHLSLNFHSFNDSHVWLINHLAQSGFSTGTCFSLTFLYPDFDDLEFTSHYETLIRSPSSKSILLLVSPLRIFSPTFYLLRSYSRFFYSKTHNCYQHSEISRYKG